jgi:hypothetical protein
MTEHENPPLYLSNEFEIDTRFRMICVSRIFVNVLFIVIGGLLLYVSIEEQNPSFFVFAIYLIFDMLLCAVVCIFLVKIAKQGGAIRMYTTLPNAEKMPTLRHYALCCHSVALPMWYVYTFAQCVVGGVFWLISSLLLITAEECDYPVVLALVFYKLLELGIRYYQLVTFYSVAVIGSVKKVLNTDRKNIKYAESRAQAIRRRAERVNPDTLPSQKKKSKEKTRQVSTEKVNTD